MIEKVKQTIRQYALFKKGDRVMVGFSGGIDSVCLLHLLHELSEYELELIALYVNHSLRPAENQAEIELLKHYGEELKIRVEQKTIDMPGRLAKKPQSLQLLAREERYRLFYEAQRKFSADKVALAHHRDDQAETIMFRIIRGTGLDGLAGIPIEREDLFVRPLLGVTRAEITEYVNTNGLSWVEDSSNQKLFYQRNRLRHQLIPQIEASYNPRFRDSLIRLGELAAEHQQFISIILRENYRALKVQDGERTGLKLTPFLDCHSYLQYHLLRTVIAELGMEYRMETKALQKLREKIVAENYKLKPAHIYKKVMVYLEAGVIYFQKALDRENRPILLNATLMAPGITGIDQIGMSFNIETVPRPEEWHGISTQEIYVDAESLCLPLRVRFWQPGDLFRPFGMAGTQKLHDFFINQKISRRLRGKIPLLMTSDNRIVWIVGCRMNNDFRVSDTTRTIWRISAVTTETTGGD